MPTQQSAHWGFTLNFSGPRPNLSFGPDVQYAVWQHERVTHDHLQGYIQFKNANTTMRKAKAEVGGAPHMQRLTINATGRKPWEYCMKPESRVDGPWEYGVLVPKGSCKRKRIEECERSPDRMRVEDPDLFNRYYMQTCNSAFRREYVGPELDRDWQKTLTAELAKPADDRSIIWVYGPDGSEGKTTYSKQLEKDGWFVTSSGSHKDIMYLYVDHGSTSNVCIDFSRSVEVDHFYPLIEDFKNRRIKSVKYRPIRLTELNNVHVVVMSNRLPDPGRISMDRIRLIRCNNCGPVPRGSLINFIN